MSLSALTAVAILAAEEAAKEPAVSPYAIGGTALFLLMFSLLVVWSFGGGREHS